jgi:hypothetical protein
VFGSLDYIYVPVADVDGEALRYVQMSPPALVTEPSPASDRRSREHAHSSPRRLLRLLHRAIDHPPRPYPSLQTPILLINSRMPALQ